MKRIEQPGSVAAIRALAETFLLVPEDAVLRIELEGELAAMLSLGSAQKQTAAAGEHDGRLVEQVKLVAGRGFEPLTFRL